MYARMQVLPNQVRPVTLDGLVPTAGHNDFCPLSHLTVIMTGGLNGRSRCGNFYFYLCKSPLISIDIAHITPIVSSHTTLHGQDS